MHIISPKNTFYCNDWERRMHKKMSEGLFLFFFLFEWFWAISGRSKQVEGNTERPLGLTKGRLRPLSWGNRLIQVQITVIKGRQIRYLDNWQTLMQSTAQYRVIAEYGAAEYRFDCIRNWFLAKRWDSVAKKKTIHILRKMSEELFCETK